MLYSLNLMAELPKYHFTQDQISTEMEHILAAQADPKNFGPLYTTYYSRVLAFIYQRVDSKDLAYDITAQTFYTALDKLNGYQDRGVPFSAWLFRIALNEMHKVFRKKKVQRTVNIDEEGAQALRVELSELNKGELDKELFNALQCLNEEELGLIEMRFFEQRSFKEICQITGLNESSAKMRIYRILGKLKSRFNKN